MPLLHVIKTRLILQTRVAEEVLLQHIPASPRVVGEELAAQVDAHVRDQGLGYYPALEFFQAQDNQAVESDLLDAAQNIAWFAGNLIQEEIQRRLRGAFSNIQIETLQCTAFTLPRVRLNQGNALELLAEHYTPDDYRVSLLLSSLYKHTHARADAEDVARKKVLRHLRGIFVDLRINSSQRV